MDSTFIKNIIKRLGGRSIFLIGMMGCGKSHTGPKIAEILEYKFIDLDNVIEKIAKKSIDNIFSQDGETIFRDLETQCLKEAIKLPSLVISTGGGIIEKSQNWGILRQGIIVWIKLEKQTALERLRGEIDKRPLIKGKNIDQIYTQIFNSRKELYSQADIKIDVFRQSVEEVAQEIIFEINKKINT